MTAFITAREVGSEIGMGQQRVRRLCREGKFAHHRIGQAYGFTPEDLAQIIDSLAVKAKEATAADTWGRRTRRHSA